MYNYLYEQNVWCYSDRSSGFETNVYIAVTLQVRSRITKTYNYLLPFISS